MEDATMWKGGEKPTGLGKGNDGFSNVPDRKIVYGGIDGGTVTVSREETVADKATNKSGS